MLQRDGGLLVFGAGTLLRLDRTGQVDPGFGVAGSITAPAGSGTPLAIAEHADGRLDVVWQGRTLETPHRLECEQHWARYSSSGAIDATFGTNGVTVLPFHCSFDMKLDSTGRSYWLVRSRDTMTYGACIEQRASAGSHLASLECYRGGSGFGTPAWRYQFLRVDARDRVLVGLRAGDGADRGFALKRFASDAPDATFGTGGVAFVPLPGSPVLEDAVALPDGGVLAVGSAEVSWRPQVVVVRLTEHGVPDPAFGEAGVAAVPLSRPDEPAPSVSRAAVLADGRIVVAATVTTRLLAGGEFARIGVGRLAPTGAPDFRLAGAGIGSAWTQAGSRLDALAVRPSGEILLAASTASAIDAAAPRTPEILQLRGGELSTAHPWRERRTAEYFHADYGHYFVTASEPEMAILDTSAPRAWMRTGKAFNVFDEDGTPLAPVCRFWSGQRFAPKSSHFYTPLADECAKVKADPVWQFEGIAFALGLADAGLGYATCSPGTRPLYRAYNDGRSGAPNHRYTTELAVLRDMIAQGWVMEGEVTTSIFACVPVPD